MGYIKRYGRYGYFNCDYVERGICKVSKRLREARMTAEDGVDAAGVLLCLWVL